MTVHEEVEQIILNALNTLNDGFNDADKITVSPDTFLFGKKAQIDSLSLVSLIVELEEQLSEKFNREIVLTDDRAMTREKSPFYNVQSLKDYVVELLTA